jgi:hypothetical protein
MLSCTILFLSFLSVFAFVSLFCPASSLDFTFEIMSTVDEAKRAKVELACSTAETFIQLYYDRLDSKRHLIGKLYMDNATMSWNGNRLEGKTMLC